MLVDYRSLGVCVDRRPYLLIVHVEAPTGLLQLTVSAEINENMQGIPYVPGTYLVLIPVVFLAAISSPRTCMRVGHFFHKNKKYLLVCDEEDPVSSSYISKAAKLT